MSANLSGIARAFAVACGSALLLITPPLAAAQPDEARFEAAVHFASVDPRQFEELDLGVGGRLSWRMMPLVGIDAEMTVYPANYPDQTAFSEGRWEGFFGPTVGPRLGRLRPFAKLRPGFVSYHEAPQPLACIAVFPPPLACTLSEGTTAFALDVGGGVDLAVTERMLVRFDIGDRLVRYDGPVRDRDGDEHADGFWAHGFRVTVGAGVRF